MIYFIVGKLSVKVKHNNSIEEAPLEQTGSYKHKFTFKPKLCGQFFLIVMISLFYSVEIILLFYSSR